MKVFGIRELPESELRKRILDEEENLVNLKFQRATSQLESPIKIRTVRRDIARMKTVLREIELKKVGASTPTSSIQKATKES